MRRHETARREALLNGRHSDRTADDAVRLAELVAGGARLARNISAEMGITTDNHRWQAASIAAKEAGFVVTKQGRHGSGYFIAPGWFGRPGGER